MKCKVFHITWARSGQSEINEWLNDTPGITIEKISSLTISSDTGYLYVFYSTRKNKLDHLNSLDV